MPFIEFIMVLLGAGRIAWHTALSTIRLSPVEAGPLAIGTSKKGAATFFATISRRPSFLLIAFFNHTVALRRLMNRVMPLQALI